MGMPDQTPPPASDGWATQLVAGLRELPPGYFLGAIAILSIAALIGLWIYYVERPKQNAKAPMKDMDDKGSLQDFVDSTSSLMTDYANTKRRLNNQGIEGDWYHDRLAQIEFELKLKPPTPRRQVKEEGDGDSK